MLSACARSSRSGEGDGASDRSGSSPRSTGGSRTTTCSDPLPKRSSTASGILTRRVKNRYDQGMSNSSYDIRELPTQVKQAAEGAVRALRGQARRPDRVGEVTHRTWELVHDGVDV